MLVAVYWRSNLTLRQLASLFGASKSAADRIIVHLGPLLALQQRKRFRKDAMLIVDGTPVPIRDHTITEPSRNYRYSINRQVVIDTDTRLVVAVGRPVTGNRNDCKAWELPGAKDAVGHTTLITDAATAAPAWSSPTAANAARANSRTGRKSTTAHTARSAPASSTPSPGMKTRKILRDCRLKGDGVHHAMLGIARLHNLTPAG